MIKRFKSFQILKIKRTSILRPSLYIAVLTLFLMSCESIKTAVFDQYAYQEAISIKVESLNLMDEAVASYSEHEDDVQTLLLDLQKILEYEKNKPNNEVSFAMWQVVTDKERNLLAGFLERWKVDSQLSKVFIGEAKGQVTEALDLIIKYEANKNKTNETNILNFLSTN
ncbi:hypothetical protein DFQ10_102388 [Winogradskyella eximia]|uniref:Uncharacterized protein n=1 Tax=Winogradskyella eximia TaxID=262006 RepID=A0A3D9H7N7_9FLAO|nr:hypothetical protein [Winogradskyella eximia]RED45515.1 hypothetical protein DFQ10_102388 [Winogradskyella eximia]